MRGIASTKCLKHDEMFLQTFSECTFLGSDISRHSLFSPSSNVLEQVRMLKSRLGNVHYEYCCPQRVAGFRCPHRGTVWSKLWPSTSMSIRLGRVVLALLSPEPSGLSQLLPGDELRVREREPSFQGSALILAGVGRGRGANSSVLGLSKGLMRQRGSMSGIGGAGALRRWGTGKMVEGSGRRGISRVSCVPE